VKRAPDLLQRMSEIVDRQRTPHELASNARIVGWVLSALGRGRWNVVKPFVATAFESESAKRELAQRRKLLAQAVRRRTRTGPSVQPQAASPAVSERASP
jgi:hypothetical protein